MPLNKEHPYFIINKYLSLGIFIIFDYTGLIAQLFYAFQNIMNKRGREEPLNGLWKKIL